MTALERIEDAGDDAQIPVLRTVRLLLRAPRPEDARRVAALAGDRRVAENTARIPHPYEVADAEAWIAGVNRSPDEAIFLIDTGGETIGACGLERRGGLPEIGYWIGVPFWGNGYATEAARALIDYAFAEREVAVLHAGALISNPASRRVLEKCGFPWTSVALCRIRALGCSAPSDRFRLERAAWTLTQNSRLERRGDQAARNIEKVTRKRTQPRLRCPRQILSMSRS
jgi:RimJ/RimL family protein N-acetyltransferase